jgi:hypothetical protein
MRRNYSREKTAATARRKNTRKTCGSKVAALPYMVLQERGVCRDLAAKVGAFFKDWAIVFGCFISIVK